MLKLTSNKSNKKMKPIQTAAMAALALSQCWMLGACAKRASLAQSGTAPITTGTPPAVVDNRQSTPQPGGPGAPGAPASPANPGKPTAPGTVPGAISLAASLESIEFDADVAHDSVRLGFGYSTDTECQSIGPMVGKISEAVKDAGTDLTPPPGVLGYVAHLNCKSKDCSEALLALTKRQAPLAGQASVKISRTAPSSLKVDTAGTPKELQAKVVSALRSQGVIEKQLSLKVVDKGATFFKIEARIPSGAIVPGKPAADGQIVTVSGRLGNAVTVSLTYADSYSDKAKSSTETLDGSAVYSEKDRTITMTFKGNDKISTLAFGDFNLK